MMCHGGGPKGERSNKVTCDSVKFERFDDDSHQISY
jgi:hypothetical protein